MITVFVLAVVLLHFPVLDLLYCENFVMVTKPKINILCLHKSCLWLGRGSGLKKSRTKTTGREIAGSVVLHEGIYGHFFIL